MNHFRGFKIMANNNYWSKSDKFSFAIRGRKFFRIQSNVEPSLTQLQGEATN